MITQFSETGSYHKDNNQENQDRIYSKENSRYRVIALADGVTACAFGGNGAQIACEAAARWVMNGGEGMYFDKEKLAAMLIEEVVFCLKQEALVKGKPLEEFASTLALACLDKRENKMLIFNLGDGAIFVRKKDKKDYLLAAPPKRLEGNAILTLHDDAYKLAYSEVMDTGDINSVLICSDGAYEMLFYEDIDELIEEPQRLDSEDDWSFIRLELEKRGGNSE